MRYSNLQSLIKELIVEAKHVPRSKNVSFCNLLYQSHLYLSLSLIASIFVMLTPIRMPERCRFLHGLDSQSPKSIRKLAKSRLDFCNSTSFTSVSTYWYYTEHSISFNKYSSWAWIHYWVNLFPNHTCICASEKYLLALIVSSREEEAE